MAVRSLNSIASIARGLQSTATSRSPNIFCCSLKMTAERAFTALTPFARVSTPGSLVSYKFLVGVTDTGENTTSAKASLPQSGGSSVTTLNAVNGLGWQDGSYGEFAATGTGYQGNSNTSDRPEIVMGGRIAVNSVSRTDVVGALPCFIVRATPTNANATNKWDFGASTVAMETPSADNRGRIIQACSASGAQLLSTALPLSSATVCIDVGVIIEYADGGVGIIGAGDSTWQNNALTPDKLSSIGWRAAAMGSSLMPMAYVNNAASSSSMGDLSAGAEGYAKALLTATAVLPCNAVIFEGWSPNDYSGSLSAGNIQAKADYYYNNIVNYIIPDSLARGYALFVTTGLPNPAALTTSVLDAIRLTFISDLKALAAQGQIILLDTNGIINDGAIPQGFITAYSAGDGVHENNAGIDFLASYVAGEVANYFQFGIYAGAGNIMSFPLSGPI